MEIEKKGKTATLIIGEDLSGKNSREFINSMKTLISEDTTRFTLDFRNVTFIDTLSLSNLIIFCNKPELDFTFRNVGNPVQKIYEILDLKKKVLYE